MEKQNPWSPNRKFFNKLGIKEIFKIEKLNSSIFFRDNRMDRFESTNISFF